MNKFFNKVDRVLTQPPVAHLLAFLSGTIAISLGVSMLLNPSGYHTSPQFADAMSRISPEVCGVILAGTGAVLFVLVIFDRKQAQLPSLILAGCYAYLSWSLIPESNASGLPAFLFLWAGISGFCVITMLACRSKEQADDQATNYHK